ncbi:MAG TPA: carboxypeptidase-like regulatory domain-containing protein [Candidatus Acidoferrum sp.]|nr:carboxypeptidase-like regulatory domain-containing protein [Candidatus Acidoferrum sp.]
MMICAFLFSFALRFTAFPTLVSPKKNSFTVVDASSGVPLSGVLVTAVGSGGFGYAYTDNKGQFNITNGLTAGNYTVVASQQGYLDAEIDNISVIAGSETSGVPLYMSLSGGVFGKVTDNVTGQGIPNVSVSVSPSYGNTTYFGSGLTDIFGTYSILTNIATGTYNISVFSPRGYVGKTIGYIPVTAGSKKTGIDLSLQRSGVISGRVTTPEDQGLANLNVTASSSAPTYFGSGETNATGYYTIVSGLGTASNYTVEATSMSPMAFNTTTDVNVVVSQETSGVDLELSISAPLPSGIIVGTVMDTNNQPLAGVQVTANGDSTFSSGTASTDQNGNYAISTGLANDTYNVTASTNGYQTQGFTDQTVTVNQITTVNFHLLAIQSGRISGTVTGDQNPITPEFQYPLIMMLIATLVAFAIIRSTEKPNMPETCRKRRSI